MPDTGHGPAVNLWTTGSAMDILAGIRETGFPKWERGGAVAMGGEGRHGMTATARTICTRCKARYNTAGLADGAPFVCTDCGAVLYAPGSAGAFLRRRDEQIAGALQAALPEVALRIAQLLREAQPGELATRLLRSGVVGQRALFAALERLGFTPRFLIPGYDLVCQLGRGGMGTVWHGAHIESRKTVAVKTLADQFARRADDLVRFHREARAVIALDHPNIVKGYDEHAVGDLHFFAMEYVHGKSTARILAKRGRFGERRALDIVRQTALALEHAHAHGFLHRDIKPDNILLTRQGFVKLADYGLVRFGDDSEGANRTATGQLLGTPFYIAPEQIKGQPAEARSDLYSLGATFYHLLVGRPPYEGANASEILRRHLHDPVPDPRDHRAGLHPHIAMFVTKLMHKSPNGRFHGAAELLEAIERFPVARDGWRPELYESFSDPLNAGGRPEAGEALP